MSAAWFAEPDALRYDESPGRSRFTGSQTTVGSSYSPFLRTTTTWQDVRNRESVSLSLSTETR